MPVPVAISMMHDDQSNGFEGERPTLKSKESFSTHTKVVEIRATEAWKAQLAQRKRVTEKDFNKEQKVHLETIYNTRNLSLSLRRQSDSAVEEASPPAGDFPSTSTRKNRSFDTAASNAHATSDGEQLSKIKDEVTSSHQLKDGYEQSTSPKAPSISFLEPVRSESSVDGPNAFTEARVRRATLDPEAAPLEQLATFPTAVATYSGLSSLRAGRTVTARSVARAGLSISKTITKVAADVILNSAMPTQIRVESVDPIQKQPGWVKWLWDFDPFEHDRTGKQTLLFSLDDEHVNISAADEKGLRNVLTERRAFEARHVKTERLRKQARVQPTQDRSEIFPEVDCGPTEDVEFPEIVHHTTLRQRRSAKHCKRVVQWASRRWGNFYHFFLDDRWEEEYHCLGCEEARKARKGQKKMLKIKARNQRQEKVEKFKQSAKLALLGSALVLLTPLARKPDKTTSSEASTELVADDFANDEAVTNEHHIPAGAPFTSIKGKDKEQAPVVDETKEDQITSYEIGEAGPSSVPHFRDAFPSFSTMETGGHQSIFSTEPEVPESATTTPGSMATTTNHGVLGKTDQYPIPAMPSDLAALAPYMESLSLGGSLFASDVNDQTE